MSHGLQVRDAAGNITVNFDDRITRFHATFSVGVIGQFTDVSYPCEPGTWVAFSSSTRIMPVVHNGFVRCWLYVGDQSGATTTATIYLYRY